MYGRCMLLRTTLSAGTQYISGLKWVLSPKKAVVIGLFIMSAYSIGVMIDNVMAYNAARKQSQQFARRLPARIREEASFDEAVKIADRYKESRLAKVGRWRVCRRIPDASDQLRRFRVKRSKLPSARSNVPKPSFTPS